MLFATGLIALTPMAATQSTALPFLWALLVVLAFAAIRSSSPAARQAVLLAVLLYLAVGLGVFGLWPLPAVVAVLGAWWLSRRPGIHPWRAWLRRGRRTPDLPWLVVGTIVATVIALAVWQRVFDGRLPQEYVEVAAGKPWGLVLAAAVAFSLLNAAVEEIIFRGVLLSSLTQVLRPALAVVLQAVAFGVLHLQGVPSGAVGLVMAGTWGLLLGIMRIRSGGLVAPYLTHIAADATIVVLMFPALT